MFLQVTLPVAITPREGHSAVVIGSGPSFRVVVLFGGNNSSEEVISETNLLWISEYTSYHLLICPHRLDAVVFHTPPPPLYCYFLCPVLLRYL